MNTALLVGIIVSVVVAVIVAVVLMSSSSTPAPSPAPGAKSPSPAPTSGAKSPSPSPSSSPAPAPAPAPVVIKPRKAIKDSGYPDGVKGDLKVGWYDIIGQGVPNDYCRYVGDGAGFFACVLSTDGEQYSKEYNGRKVEDIARTAMKDACANTSDGNVSIECYKAIWANEGCKNMDKASENYNWAKGQTKATLVNDSKAWATMTDTNHRQGCYGADQTNWPKSYIRYSQRTNYMHY